MKQFGVSTEARFATGGLMLHVAFFRASKEKASLAGAIGKAKEKKKKKIP